MSFDKSKLTGQDYRDLYEAVKKTGPKINAWYFIPKTRLFSINQEDVAKQTLAVSDYEKECEQNPNPYKNESNVKKVHLSETRETRNKIFGRRDIDICVHNPGILPLTINIGKKQAELLQIDGIGFGNTYEGRVVFDRGIAILEEQDQGLAHKLGFEYTPAHILEISSLEPSDINLHKDKKRTDKFGDTILYCDNPACKKQIKNPVLVIDKLTGGIYHSDICYWKDIEIKKYLIGKQKGQDLESQVQKIGNEGIIFNPDEIQRKIASIETQMVPIKVNFNEVLRLYKEGELQQSLNNKKKFKIWGKINVWPDAAILFHQ